MPLRHISMSSLNAPACGLYPGPRLRMDNPSMETGFQASTRNAEKDDLVRKTSKTASSVRGRVRRASSPYGVSTACAACRHHVRSTPHYPHHGGRRAFRFPER
jgi:hypothetical protein